MMSNHACFIYVFFFPPASPFRMLIREKITGKPPCRSTKNRHKHAPQTFLASIRTTVSLLCGHMSSALLLNGLRTSFSSQSLVRASQGFMAEDPTRRTRASRRHDSLSYETFPHSLLPVLPASKQASIQLPIGGFSSRREAGRLQRKARGQPPRVHLAIRSRSSLISNIQLFFFNLYIYIFTNPLKVKHFSPRKRTAQFSGARIS